MRRPSLLSWSTLGVTVFGVLYALMYLAIAPNGTLGMIIVLGSSGWVYVDATKHGLRRGMGQGLADMSPGGWFGACLLLWIIAFPMYLIKRSELITRAAAYYGGTPIGRLPAQKSSGWSCLATALLFTILGIVGLGILSLLSAPTSRTTFVAAGAPPAEAPPAEVPAQTAPEVVSPAYTVQKIETSWTVTSRGFTELDGQLWVPEVRATIRNTGDTPTEELYLRAVFYDQDKVIKGDPSIESLESIPAGFAKGPVFLHGSVGYTNDFALLMMGEQPQQMWNYELSIGTSYFGPWETIEKGVVELPPGYRPVKQDPGPSASADKPQAL